MRERHGLFALPDPENRLDRFAQRTDRYDAFGHRLLPRGRIADEESCSPRTKTGQNIAHSITDKAGSCEIHSVCGCGAFEECRPWFPTVAWGTSIRRMRAVIGGIDMRAELVEKCIEPGCDSPVFLLAEVTSPDPGLVRHDDYRKGRTIECCDGFRRTWKKTHTFRRPEIVCVLDDGSITIQEDCGT